MLMVLEVVEERRGYVRTGGLEEDVVLLFEEEDVNRGGGIKVERVRKQLNRGKGTDL